MSNKDYNRSVCPSKLSKRELEDLYYSLQQNNLELKKTINAQTEQNRILSTKVQRMTAQSKTGAGKDCCGAAKAIINEQRAGIEDLTKANEALADRIRKLSIQLCTAKQFLKQNSSARSCYKCFSNANNSVKILSSTSLQNKSFAANLKSAATSATHMEQGPPSTKTTGTNPLQNDVNDVDNVEKKNAEICNENRCRSVVEQFKRKIQDLEEELAKTHTEYSSRMSQLEHQVSQLQSAALRARSEQNFSAKDSLELARGLRNADADKVDLETQLSIEKSKVAELEMRLKAAKLSQQVARTVENHLSNAYQREEKQLRETSGERCSVCSNMIVGDTSPHPVPTTTNKAPNELTVPDDKLSKSDDSGYAEHRREIDTGEKNNQTNQELLKRITEIQVQMDALKSVKPVPTAINKTPNELTVPDEKLSKSGDSGYAEHRREIDTGEKNNQTNQELLKRISEIQVQMDALKSVKPVPTAINKTPNELTVPDEKLFKSGDSGYAEHRREIDTGEKNNQTNQELLKRITEIQAQLDALKSIKAEKDTANQEPTKNVDLYTSNHEPEFQDKNKNVIPNPTRVSIFGSGATDIKEIIAVPERTNKTKLYNEQPDNTKPTNVKLDTTNETDTPTKDNEYLYKDIYKNDSESDKSSPRNEISQAKDSKQRAVEIDCVCPDNEKVDLETNTLTKTSNESNEIPEKKLSRKINKEDQLVNSVKESQGDNNSSNLLQKDVEMVQPKPVNYYTNEKPNPKSPSDDIKQDSSTIRPHSFIRTPKPYTPKAEDNFQPTPEPLPVISESTAKRIVSITKKKVKSAGSKRKSDEVKDQNKVGRKSINGKDKKSLGKHEKDVSDTRKVHPSEIIGVRGTEEHKGEDYVEKLPLDHTINTNGMRRVNEYAICEHHVTFCSCFETPGPHLSVFRSCSGSEILASFPKDRFRRCACSDKATCLSDGSNLQGPIGSSTPKPDYRVPTPMSPHTYTVESDKSRANSPANTDHEISVMTDLPSEKDDTYNRPHLSPGEHRTMGTSTETNTPRNGYTLSEGEVPVNVQRRMSKSIGEVRRNDYTKTDTSYGEQQSPREKMEATLEVISQELARCRSLLQTRPREPKQSVATDVDPVSLVLRKTDGKSRFDGTVTPTCVFTMHVMSVVLSDEAILKTRDANLVLKWRFYHKTAMTPIAKGRVTHFDFSTQFGLQMTTEMEQYLKNEDMLIMVCEMDSSKKPLATCALPLRQVLLNINRRVDMSLPLRAGPHPRKTSGNLQTNDDIGVLDVWCMLICK